ncbi:MAG: hypothetical protein QOF62_2283 [Pyrinomonadaceae bacterium]|jgi:hypothetical protein|nr:hypothetical protein [Pyrinomonadaceae bacterium]
MDPQTSHNGNHAVVGEEQNLESDFYPWKISDATEKEATTEKTRVDAEFYKRVGFYSAFNKSSEDEFRQAIGRLVKSVEKRVGDLTIELDEDVARFTIRKEEAENKREEIKASLKRYEEEVQLLKNDLPLLKARLEALRGEIRNAVVDIGAKKETLIKDRQEALLDELNRLNAELETVVRTRMSLNEEIFEKQKEALEKKKIFLLALFEQYHREHRDVLSKLRLLNVSGFHFLSSSFLYNAGFVAATVAGAFFASFAETNYFASGGILSFVVQGLFAFSTGFIGQSPEGSPPAFSARLMYAGVLLAIFLVLLALIFAVSWICHAAYKRLLQTDSQAEALKSKDSGEGDLSMNNFAIEINLNNEFPVRAAVREKTFFGFWIKAIPYLLFLTIAFLLVSLGTDMGNIKSLDASMAGYGMGFLIALGCGGVSYVYLTMVLEKRVEQRAESQTDALTSNAGGSWVRLNLELFVVILTFIAIVLITLFGFQHPFKSASNTLSIVSLMFFAGACLLTALLLGFGLRLQGLDASRRELEQTCDIIQTKLIRISRPLQIYLTQVENAHFNRRFILIRDEIMNLMLARTRVTRKAIDTPLIKIDEHDSFLMKLNKWLKGRRLVSRFGGAARQTDEQPHENDLSGFTASEEIRLCFPKLEAELGALEAEAKEVRERIASIETEMKFRTEQKGEFYEKKLRELQVQEIRARNYHKAITNRKRKSHYDINLELRKQKFFTQKIVEGFELGDWFTRHGLKSSKIPHLSHTTNGGNHD